MGNILVGKTVTGVSLASDKKAILFKTETEDIVARCDGDCCSSTWVEHIELPAAGFPAEVLSVEDINMPDQGSPDEYEVVAYYGCKITTDKGHMIIDYRNESNGYYGGDLVWPDEGYFYGGVYGQNISNNDWVEIKEDV